MTPITRAQAKKIFRALAYSFVSGFVGTMALVGLDFVNAAVNGQTAIVNLAIGLIGAALVGGINAVAVTVKQLLTPADR